MISQKTGVCRQGYSAGDPIFWHPDAGNWHWDCWESQPPSPGIIALAERLGYQRQEQETIFGDSESWSF